VAEFRPADVEILLQNGADKVSINSSVKKPTTDQWFGTEIWQSCVVVAIDAKQIDGRWIVHLVEQSANGIKFIWLGKRSGTEGQGNSVYSMDNDGTKNGFANEALSKLSSVVNIL
jgi:cyclase